MAKVYYTTLMRVVVAQHLATRAPCAADAFLGHVASRALSSTDMNRHATLTVVLSVRLFVSVSMSKAKSPPRGRHPRFDPLSRTFRFRGRVGIVF